MAEDSRSPWSPVSVPDKVIIQARAAAFTGALLLAPSDFGVSLFAVTANVAAASKRWSPRETLIISGGALLAFVCAPIFALLLAKIGMVRTTVCAALLMITAYTLLALSLLSSSPAWCSNPAITLVLNFLGVAGSSGIGVTSKKVVTDTVAPLKGNRSLAMSLLHAMTLSGPTAMIFLLASYVGPDHVSVYIGGAMTLVAVLVTVGIFRIQPYYKLLEYQKEDLGSSSPSRVPSPDGGYGSGGKVKAHEMPAMPAGPPATNLVMPEPFLATKPERDRFNVYWVVLLLMSLIGPASMVFLRFASTSLRTTATAVATAVAGVQVLVAVFVPYFAKWYNNEVLPEYRDEVESDESPTPKKAPQDFSKDDNKDQEMRPVSIVSAVAGTAAAVATTSAASAMSEPVHPHHHLHEEYRPGDVFPEGLAPKWGWVWWAVVFILGGSLAVGQAVVMTLPFISFSLQPVQVLPANRTLASVPYDTVQATAIVASLLQFFAISALLAGVVMVSASGHHHHHGHRPVHERLWQRLVTSSSAEQTLKLIDLVMKPLYVTLGATIVMTVIIMALASSLHQWRYNALFFCATMISLSIGFIAAGSITMSANIFVANIFASTFSTSRFLAGILATTLLFGVSVPFQEYQMNEMNQKYQIGQQTFCLGSPCFSGALWVYAAIHAVVVVAVGAVGVYMYRLRKTYDDQVE